MEPSTPTNETAARAGRRPGTTLPPPLQGLQGPARVPAGGIGITSPAAAAARYPNDLPTTTGRPSAAHRAAGVAVANNVDAPLTPPPDAIHNRSLLRPSFSPPPPGGLGTGRTPRPELPPTPPSAGLPFAMPNPLDVQPQQRSQWLPDAPAVGPTDDALLLHDALASDGSGEDDCPLRNIAAPPRHFHSAIPLHRGYSIDRMTNPQNYAFDCDLRPTIGFGPTNSESEGVARALRLMTEAGFPW